MPRLLYGVASPPPVAPELLGEACDNARTLARLCELLEVPTSRSQLLEQLEELEPEDGAFILPEEV